MCQVWHRNQRFQIKTKLIWNFQYLISFGTYVFWTLNMPHIDENTENPQIFTRKTPKAHVCKTWGKWTKIHFFLRWTKYWKYIRGLLSRSHFTFFQIPEPILTPSTVIYLFRRKVTKSTIHPWKSTVFKYNIQKFIYI